MDLANEIRRRRKELGLTIEEAARKAGVGTKTWCRYEAGGSVRKDKGKGVCKALNWRSWPDSCGDLEGKYDWKANQTHEAWSDFLFENYGPAAASSFVIGSDMLLDYIEQDMEELARLPRYSHVGQLGTSFLVDELPAQFLVRYDYEFLYKFRCVLLLMRRRAGKGLSMLAHTVLEELALYMCYKVSEIANELGMDLGDIDDIWADGEWVFDLFSDADIVTMLYSDIYVDETCSYHFVHWDEHQFWQETNSSSVNGQ